MIVFLLLLTGAYADEVSTETVNWTPPLLITPAATSVDGTPLPLPLAGPTPNPDRRARDGLVLPTYERPMTKRKVIVVGSAVLSFVVAGALVDVVGPRR